jgi:hypothetical protein
MISEPKRKVKYLRYLQGQNDKVECRLEQLEDKCYTLKLVEYVILAQGRGGSRMEYSYNKLWKLLIDKEMTRSDLKEASGVSVKCKVKT